MVLTGVLTLVALAPSTAVGGPSFCWSAAWNMMRACKIDSREELHVTRANCDNLGSTDERLVCRDEANTVRVEALEEWNSSTPGSRCAIS